MRKTGGGDTGNFLDIPCIPNATLRNAITGLIAANTPVTGRMVKLTWDGDYQVTTLAEGEIPDGEIITFEKDNVNGYILGVRLFHYMDNNGGHHSPMHIKTLNYNGMIAFHNTVAVIGDDWSCVANGGASGWGAVISKDNSAKTVDVLF